VNASPVPIAATIALEMIGPIPGTLIKRSQPASRHAGDAEFSTALASAYGLSVVPLFMLMGRSRRVTSARPATTKGCRVVQWQCGGRSALSALIFGVGPLLAASAVAINRHNLDLLCDDRQAAGNAEKLQGRQTFLCGGLNRGTTLSGQISPSYASTNRRGKCTTYRAVCGKRATLLDNADRASRKPRCGLELNKRLEC
jgi:hypothetical protein